MGSSHGVELFANQESPTEPGKLSVISASLDALSPPVSAEVFLQEYFEVLKHPVDGMMEFVMKSCTVTENAGPDDVTMKLVVDGAKLDKYGRGRGDGMDRVRAWKRICVDRKALRVSTDDYVSEPELGAWADEASDKEAVAHLYMQMLSGPTRAEFWAVDGKGNNRVHDDELVKALYGFVDPAIAQIHLDACAKVRVTFGKSIKDPGQESVLSEAMDEHVTYDKFFSKMVAIMQRKMHNTPDSSTEESEGKIVCRTKTPDATGQEELTVQTVTYSAESGEITAVVANAEGVVKYTSCRQLHRSPLVWEAWNLTGEGERTIGAKFAKDVQKEIMETIDRANSWFG